MQNIALLQAAAAFPGLIETVATRRLALARLTMQLRYYLSDEGVILEHSAGYHLAGVELVAAAIQLAELNHLTVPPVWKERLKRARLFLARIMRPDGTLPAFGDTRVQVPEPTAWTAPGVGEQFQSPLSLYSLSGYGVWAASDPSGRVLNHTMVNWSYFPGQAHKHADETGLSVWALGRGWITPSGYAPYGSEFRLPVDGWLGSNAQHGEGEDADSARKTDLLGSASSHANVFLDLKRSTAHGATFRRQVVGLARGRWLVIDQPLGTAQWTAVETVWTFYPDLTVEPLGLRVGGLIIS